MLVVIQKCFVCFAASVCLSLWIVLDVVVGIDPQVVMNLVLVVDEKVVRVVEVVVVAVEKVDPVGLPLVLLGTESPSPQVVEVQVVELQEAIGGPPIHLAVGFVRHHGEFSHLRVSEQIVHTQKHHELGCAQLALSGNLTAATRFCCQDPCRGTWLFCSRLAFCGILLSNASRQAESQAQVPECFLDWSSAKLPSSK